MYVDQDGYIDTEISGNMGMSDNNDPGLNIIAVCMYENIYSHLTYICYVCYEKITRPTFILWDLIKTDIVAI